MLQTVEILKCGDPNHAIRLRHMDHRLTRQPPLSHPTDMRIEDVLFAPHGERRSRGSVLLLLLLVLPYGPRPSVSHRLLMVPEAAGQSRDDVPALQLRLPHKDVAG